MALRYFLINTHSQTNDGKVLFDTFKWTGENLPKPEDIELAVIKRRTYTIKSIHVMGLFEFQNYKEYQKFVVSFKPR